MRRPLAGLATLLVVLLAVAAWAARTETGQTGPVPFGPWSGLFLIGLGGEGSMTIDGGTAAVEDSVALGAQATGDGSLVVTGAGSSLTLVGDAVSRANALNVGAAGTGSAQILGGAVVDVDATGNLPGDQGASVLLAFEPTGVGDLLVSGAGSQLLLRNGAADNSGVSVGYLGQGTARVEAGATLAVDTGSGDNSGVSVGGSGDPGSPGGEGSLVVTGPGTSLATSGDGTGITIGLTGTGAFTLDDGATANAHNLFVGLYDVAGGSVLVGPGAELRIEGTNTIVGFGGVVDVGLAGTGSLAIEDGTLIVDDQDGIGHGLQVGGTTGCGGPCPFTGGTGSWTVSGPDAQVLVQGEFGGVTIGADGFADAAFSGGALVQVENPSGFSGASVGFSPGAVGTLVVEGPGTLFDTGAGLNLGVDPALLDAGDADVTVRDGAELRAQNGVAIGATSILRGDGTIDSDLFNFRGTVWAGDPTGSLTVDGLYQQAEATAELRVGLAGTGPGEWSQLDAAGDLDVAVGGVRVDALGGFLPAAGAEFPIATSGGTITEGASYAFAGADLAWEVTPEAGALVFRALSEATGFGACQSGQLKALSKLCKKALGCDAKRVKKPAKDPGGAKRDACVAKAEAGFAKAWDKATAKGAKKGEPCVLDDDAPTAAAALVTAPTAVFLADVLEGWDEAAGNGDDDKLRASLVKEGATLCSKLWGADGKQMAKRNDAKWAKGRDKARSRFDGKGQKAIDQATGKGVVYGGAPVGTLGDTVTDVVARGTERSAGVVR